MLTPNQNSAGQFDQPRVDPKEFLDAYTADDNIKELIAARNPNPFDRVRGATGDSIAQDKSSNYVWQWQTMQKLKDLLKNTWLVTSLKGLLAIQLKATWSRLVKGEKKKSSDLVNKELVDLLTEQVSQTLIERVEKALKQDTPKT